tara:strand:+ start:217 stop:417 length:201 start_codon:yes stop_codon:yes gene_type:complete
MSDGTEVPDPTAEEIATARTNAVNATHYASWVWNESEIKYIPPIAYPSDGLPYLWDEDTAGWVAFS